MSRPVVLRSHPVAHLRQIWEVNTMSHVMTARHLFPKMAARGGGQFCITASAAGLLTQVGSL